jgi:hypothetical protein
MRLYQNIPETLKILRLKRRAICSYIQAAESTFVLPRVDVSIKINLNYGLVVNTSKGRKIFHSWFAPKLRAA